VDSRLLFGQYENPEWTEKLDRIRALRDSPIAPASKANCVPKVPALLDYPKGGWIIVPAYTGRGPGSGGNAMSDLVFDGAKHHLTYYSKDGSQIGDGWYANNVVDRKIKNLPFLPNRLYNFLDRHYPHRHGNASDTIDGSYGRFGILRLQTFLFNGVTHEGVGIHSGRRSKGGADHPTHGCIRTTDDVMEALVYYILNDPLDTLLVINNHDQHHKHHHLEGDGHVGILV
jgi:hypothetical protein